MSHDPALRWVPNQRRRQRARTKEDGSAPSRSGADPRAPCWVFSPAHKGGLTPPAEVGAARRGRSPAAALESESDSHISARPGAHPTRVTRTCCGGNLRFFSLLDESTRKFESLEGCHGGTGACSASEERSCSRSVKELRARIMALNRHGDSELDRDLGPTDSTEARLGHGLHVALSPPGPP